MQAEGFFISFVQHFNLTIVIVAENGKSEIFATRHLDLVEACKKGDQKAQFELYRLYHVAMYNTSLRIVGDSDDAEDVMQEAFLKAFLRLDSYRGEVSFGAWLKRIVINKALDFLRLKREHISLEDAGEVGEMVEESSESLDAEYEADAIKKAIYMLPEGYRVVLSLILLEGYDHEEVSSILNISNATSRTQYHRAKKRLIELLRRNKFDHD
jgi:RNA polymerase sigma-70 factor (ECF subfamily)